MTVAEILQAEREFRVQFWTQAAPQSACPTCTTYGCCKELVAASGVEVFLLIAAHAKEVNASWERLVEQSKYEFLEVSRGIFEARRKGEAVSRHPATLYFKHNRQCAFRDSGQCTVYDMRPLPCTFEAVAAGTPPDHCEPTFTEDVPHLNCWGIHKIMLDNYTAASASLNLDLFPALCNVSGAYPLPLAMSVVYHTILLRDRKLLDVKNPDESGLIEKADKVEAVAKWLPLIVKSVKDRRNVWE